MIALVDYITGY